MIVQVVWLLCPVCEEKSLLMDCQLEETGSADVFRVICPKCPCILAMQTIHEMPRKVILAYDFDAHVELRTTYNLPGSA